MDEKGQEITFLFQFGLIRDAVTVPQSSLNLKTIKDLASEFLNSKVCFFANDNPNCSYCFYSISCFYLNKGEDLKRFTKMLNIKSGTPMKRYFTFSFRIEKINFYLRKFVNFLLQR